MWCCGEGGCIRGYSVLPASAVPLFSVCDILAIHFKSFRFLACWCFSIPWYGVHFQCLGCVVPSAYICLKMFVILWVMLYGRAFSSSGATLLGSVALPELICAFARVAL